MPIFTTDLTEYAELVHRVLRDSEPPVPVDAICFFGQTHENDSPALWAIAKQWMEHACPILIAEYSPIEIQRETLVRGSDAWIEELFSHGVDRESILAYPMSDRFPPSTDAEAYGMVEVIKRNGWKRLVVTVPPLHAVRAFVSLVSACKKSGLEDVLIWSAPSDAPEWEDFVSHSESDDESTSRTMHISSEMAKIFAYCAKGDLLTAREILDYMKKRSPNENTGEAWVHQ